MANEPRAWTARRWWTMVGLVLLLHVGFIVSLSDKKNHPVRAVSGVPTLRLADARDEFIALSDPTLFALPHPNDFASPVWMRSHNPPPPAFRWTEPPRTLPLPREQLGRAFGQFMQTNQFAAWTLDFKPAPQFSQPAVTDTSALPQQSSLHVRGELARRPLLAPLRLNDWPEPGLLLPSKVQVLVDAAGRVVSAVLLPPDSSYDSAAHDDSTVHDDLADQKALALARAARFAPASGFTIGQLIFNWHAVPVPATNPPAATLP